MCSQILALQHFQALIFKVFELSDTASIPYKLDWV
jgi:hypothetical protein